MLLNATEPAAAEQPVTDTPDAASTLDSVGGPVTALVADAELSQPVRARLHTGRGLLGTQRSSPRPR